MHPFRVFAPAPLLALFLAGCSGPQGPAGAEGAPGAPAIVVVVSGVDASAGSGDADATTPVDATSPVVAVDASTAADAGDASSLIGADGGADASDGGPGWVWVCFAGQYSDSTPPAGPLPFCGAYPYMFGKAEVDSPQADCNYMDAGVNGLTNWSCGNMPAYPVYPCAPGDTCTNWINDAKGLRAVTGYSTHACSGLADCAAFPTQTNCRNITPPSVPGYVYPDAGSYCTP